MAFFVFAPLLASTLGDPIECSACTEAGGTGCGGDNKRDIIAIESGTTTGHIDVGAFLDCANLRGVTIKPGVTTINNFALGSNSMTSLSIPSTVTTMGNAVFGSTFDLATVTFEAGFQMTTLPLMIFYQTSSLTSITLPSSIVEIGNKAFEESGLTSIEIPVSVQTIGTDAFKSNEALASVTFADDSVLTTIEESAFKGCNSLNLVKIPNTVTIIGDNAFEGVDPTRRGRRGLLQAGPGPGGLDSVSIPAGATVGDDAFANQACDENLYQRGTTMCGCDTTDDSCFLEGGAPTEAPTEAAPPLSPVAITGIALGSVVGAVAIGYISCKACVASGSGSGSGSTESGQKLLSSTYL